MKSFFTCEQPKNCSLTITKWLQPFRAGIRLSLFLLLSFIFSSNLKAQTITLDGNPGDWANFTNNFPTNSYVLDAVKTNDNQFTMGSKDGNALSTWAWVLGQTNNKGDIENAGAVLTTVGGHNILYFMGDRQVNNGDANIGFWFFKNKVSLTATGFSGVHANGDLLIVSAFTGGGGTATITVYEWQGTGLGAGVSYNTAAVNSKIYPVPGFPFTYTSANYPIGDFFEGSLDLTNLGVAPCFTNFLMDTRNSQSLTASLQDFAFGSFSQTIAPPTTTGAARCGTGSVTLGASGIAGGIFKWYSDAGLTNLVFTGSSYTTPSLSGTTIYYVTTTTTDGCVSRATQVTATINPNPKVVAGATPAGPLSLAQAPPYYTLSTTVNTVLNPSSGFTYSWTQDLPTTDGVLSSTTIPNPTFPATTAGKYSGTITAASPYTWTVTATDVNGCFASSSVARSFVAAASCPTISSLTLCAGGTGTITSSAIPAFTHYDWSIVSPANGATITSAVTHDVTSINVQAGSANFTVLVTVSYDNTNLAPLTSCTQVVTVNPGATVGAGGPQTICFGTTATMAGSFGGGATSATWSTSGTGTFDNPSSPTAVYTPSSADSSAGSVTLTYTTNDPAGPCGPASDKMVLTINPPATVSAGTPQTICAGTAATMNGSFGGGASSATWTTSGTGSFDNPSSPTAVYTPSAADIAAGSVTLTYTTNDPAGPCGPVSDHILLTINAAAVGPNVTLNPISCTDVSFSVTVTNPVNGSTYTLTQMAGGVGPVSITFHTGDANPTFTGLTLGKGYSVTATTSGNCKSLPTQCGTFANTLQRVATTQIQANQVIQLPTVIAAPNPFNDRIRFSLKSPVSGNGYLELYNMLGQRVNTVYQGYIEKGMVKTIDYNVPYAQRANLIYLFRVANHQVSGILIGLK